MLGLLPFIYANLFLILGIFLIPIKLNGDVVGAYLGDGSSTSEKSDASNAAGVGS